jgi:carboxymethylenebutenolidase
MCYDDDARPPAPPVIGPVGERGDLVLESADGTRFGAYHADPQAPSNRAIVIMPDVRGLHTFYRELALRWAEAGLHAVAVDYYGRTAGIGPRDDFPYREHLAKLDFTTVAQDTSTAVAWIRERTGATAVFTVGFCLGGAMSWRQAATADGLAGCIGFYGIPSRAEEVADRIAAPVLMLAAGADKATPVPVAEEFADRLRRLGVDVGLHVYPDAPHSFFDVSFAEHREACADAWHRMLAFVDRYAV